MHSALLPQINNHHMDVWVCASEAMPKAAVFVVDLLDFSVSQKIHEPQSLYKGCIACL